MRSISRRLWTRSVTAVAVSLVLAATISGLFSLAVQEVPGYRQQVQDRIRQAIGQPVTIGAISLRWHWFKPVLQIDDIVLPAVQPATPPALQIMHLRLGFSLLHVMARNWMPTQVTLVGTRLHLLVHDGRVSIAGFENASGGDPTAMMNRLDGIARLRLERSTILFTDGRISASSLSFAIPSAVLNNSTGLHRLDAEIRLPDAVGGSLSMSARWDHPLVELRRSSGSWSFGLADVTAISANSGLYSPLPSQPQITAQGLLLESQGEWSGGRLSQARNQLHLTSLDAVVEGQRIAGFGKTDLAAQINLDDAGYHLLIDPLQINGLRGRWPASRLAADWLPATTTKPGQIGVQASFLRLDDLLPWLALMRPNVKQTLGSSLTGDVTDLAWRRTFADDSSSAWGNELRLTFSHAGLRGAGAIPDVTGLSGHAGLSDDKSRIEIQLDGDDAELRRPGLLAVPLDFDHLAAHLQLTPDGAGWKLTSTQMDYAFSGVAGTGSLTLSSQPGASPLMDFALDFSSPDGTRMKPLMPVTWNQETRDWITTAIQRFAVPKAHFEAVGPALDFPYGKRPTGRWQVDLEVADGVLQFRPDWPAVQNLHANLHFDGPGLHLVADQGSLGGSFIDHVDADIAHFSDQPRLLLDGRAHGEAADVYDLIKHSPLHSRLGPLVDHTVASGPVRATLHLEVPLKAGEPPMVDSGVISLLGNRLAPDGLKAPLTGLAGDVAFDATGVRSNRLTGKFYGTDLVGSIAADPESPVGIVRVSFAVGFHPDDDLVDAFIPSWLGARLNGRSAWTGEFPLSGQNAGRLELKSDLNSVAVNLPAPLYKPASEPSRLELDIGSDARGRLSIGVGYGTLLTGVLGFGDRESSAGLQAVHLYLDDQQEPASTEAGIFIQGRVPRLNLPGWLAFIDEMGAKGADSADHGDAAVEPAFRRLELTAAQTELGRDFHAPQIHAVVTPTDAGFHAALDGEGAEGTVDTNGADDNRRIVTRLDHLVALADAQKNLGAPPSATPIATDPGGLPIYDVSCLNLRIGDADLGRFDAKTERIAGGEKIDSLQLSGGLLTANASGSWQRDAAGSRAKLDFHIDSPDLGKVLTAFNYAASLTGRHSEVAGALSWSSDPKGIELARASGKVSLKVDNGSLTAVNASAARVLGLLNLYALPRRLLLNFRDVTDKGLAFDHLHGSFDLADGQAHTDDMELTGAAYRITMKGRIGLVARDFDERITVYPDVSTSAVIASTLLGGPIAGGIVLVAQELLGKPLNKLSQFSYSLTGSWDDPVANSPEVKASAPAASTAVAPPPARSVGVP